jgi:Protein of unknown function (DUF1566)
MLHAAPVLDCPATGQRLCYDADGGVIACQGTGQDAEFAAGRASPVPRFEAQGELVLDRLTGLVWPRNANLAEWPLTWPEALEFVAVMNRARRLGFADWRLPNRRELRSLMSHHTSRPALPQGHPFIDVFSGWYWTSTSAAISPAHAWYVHTEGARMFYGGKDQSYMVWLVRGTGYGVLAATGQLRCYDADGGLIACAGTGQDGERRGGRPWPELRFAVRGDGVEDALTGLRWRRQADLTGSLVTWTEALAAVAELNRRAAPEPWRLPNINELESLVDCATHSPALPQGHPFEDMRAGYWSSTTSAFEPDWAWALYLDRGAVGVGQKRGRHFQVWAVCGGHYESSGPGRASPPGGETHESEPP